MLIEPDPAAGTVTVANGHDFADTSHLAFDWQLTREGEPVASGTLDVPVVPAGETGTVALPADAVKAAGDGGETWLTVRATLAGATAWGDAGHEIAFGQALVDEAAPVPVLPTARTSTGAGLRLGPAEFDERGQLVALRGLPVDGPRLDLWRAPTDNDEGHHGKPVAEDWRRIGLHRLQHRVVSVDDRGDQLVVTTHVCPAATDIGYRAVFEWTADGDRLRLDLDAQPVGNWYGVLPRIGVRMAVPKELEQVTWFGTGPGESYPDSRRAARVGRFSLTVDEWQTPYVFPQENGHRGDVRWATLTGADGTGLRIEGDPTFGLTVRRWTTEALAEAKHTTDLVAGDRIWLNLDVAQEGLGSASCGPGVLPEYRLRPEPAILRVVLSAG